MSAITKTELVARLYRSNLSPHQRRIADCLVAAYPGGVSRDDLIGATYGDLPPMTADQSILTSIALMRPKLDQNGLAIPKMRKRRDGPHIYSLEAM